MGIPCSLLIFMSIATSKRGLHGYSLFGDEDLLCVQKSNCQLSRAALLALVCTARAVWWVGEQPASSRLPKLTYFAHLLEDDRIETYFTGLSET